MRNDSSAAVLPPPPPAFVWDAGAIPWPPELRNCGFGPYELVKLVIDFLPPGYMFHPNDDELVSFYLSNKIGGRPLPPNTITDVKLYDHSPDYLTGRYPKSGGNKWFFFTPRDRKYPNGHRPNRAAGGGFWKATGSDRPVRSSKDGSQIGSRKSLVYYRGKAPGGEKTKWMMKEYMIGGNDHRDFDGTMKLDEWVLCAIHETTESKKKGATQPCPDGSDGHPRRSQKLSTGKQKKTTGGTREPTPANLADQNDDAVGGSSSSSRQSAGLVICPNAAGAAGVPPGHEPTYPLPTLTGGDDHRDDGRKFLPELKSSGPQYFVGESSGQPSSSPWNIVDESSLSFWGAYDHIEIEARRLGSSSDRVSGNKEAGRGEPFPAPESLMPAGDSGIISPGAWTSNLMQPWPNCACPLEKDGRGLGDGMYFPDRLPYPSMTTQKNTMGSFDMEIDVAAFGPVEFALDGGGSGAHDQRVGEEAGWPADAAPHAAAAEDRAEPDAPAVVPAAGGLGDDGDGLRAPMQGGDILHYIKQERDAESWGGGLRRRQAAPPGSSAYYRHS